MAVLPLTGEERLWVTVFRARDELAAALEAAATNTPLRDWVSAQVDQAIAGRELLVPREEAAAKLEKRIESVLSKTFRCGVDVTDVLDSPSIAWICPQCAVSPQWLPKACEGEPLGPDDWAPLAEVAAKCVGCGRSYKSVGISWRWCGYVRTDDGQYFVQVPNSFLEAVGWPISECGFSTLDDDQSWDGGFELGSWEPVDVREVPVADRKRLDWILVEIGLLEPENALYQDD